MPEIKLDPEQAEIVAKALEPVKVCGPDGAMLALIKPAFTAADIAEAKQARHSDEPWYTTEQVLEHLRSLESK